MQNNSKKFRELLGDDIVFFNKIEKKPEHRGLPPLEKEFIEAVVMLN